MAKRHVIEGQVLAELIGLPLRGNIVGMRPKVSIAALMRLTRLSRGQIEYRVATYKRYIYAQTSTERELMIAARQEVLERYSTD